MAKIPENALRQQRSYSQSSLGGSPAPAHLCSVSKLVDCTAFPPPLPIRALPIRALSRKWSAVALPIRAVWWDCHTCGRGATLGTPLHPCPPVHGPDLTPCAPTPCPVAGHAGTRVAMVLGAGRTRGRHPGRGRTGADPTGDGPRVRVEQHGAQSRRDRAISLAQGWSRWRTAPHACSGRIRHAQRDAQLAQRPKLVVTRNALAGGARRRNHHATGAHWVRRKEGAEQEWTKEGRRVCRLRGKNDAPVPRGKRSSVNGPRCV